MRYPLERGEDGSLDRFGFSGRADLDLVSPNAVFVAIQDVWLMGIPTAPIAVIWSLRFWSYSSRMAFCCS